MTKDQILTEALALNPQDRDEVAATLWQSLAPGELTSDQLAEIHRRVEALDSGESTPIPGDEVMRELRQRFGR